MLDVELRRSGSKGRPSGAGRQPVVEEKEAGKQTNISPQADTSISLQTRANISPQPLEIFSADGGKYFSASRERFPAAAWETSLMAGEVPDTEAR